MQRGEATKISNLSEKTSSITNNKEQEEKLKSVWNRLCNAADHIAETADTLKPALNLISLVDPNLFPKWMSLPQFQNILETGVDFLTGASDQNKFASTKELFNGLTTKKLEKIADAIARKISLSYEEQILLLSNEGAKEFAEYACNCIFGALLNGLLTEQDEIITHSWLGLYAG